MMKLLDRARRLRELGVLGLNRRNTECILDQNPRWRFPQVDDKRRMRELCRAIGVPTPALYAVICAHSALRHLPRLLEKRKTFVLKPNHGAGGRGVLVVIGRDGPAFVKQNGARLTFEELAQHVSSTISGLYSLGGRPDEALVQQRVVPHPAFEPISYQGTADARVIVYRGVPLMAMLRLPTKESGGRANLHQGALGVGVDLDSGRTTRAVLRNRVTRRHPDTEVSVIGFEVPYWSRILEMACQVSRATQLGYLGVDVVVDRDQGPLVLEANARPGLAIQIANGAGLLRRRDEIDGMLGGAA